MSAAAYLAGSALFFLGSAISYRRTRDRVFLLYCAGSLAFIVGTLLAR